MRIKKGDQVKIIAGKDRGKAGKVADVSPSSGRITVEGLNLYKKRVRPRKQGETGETVSVPRPLSASNAQPVCPVCKRAVRAAFRIEGGKKSRYCRKCGASF